MQEFAMYYQIPTVSIKACCYHLLANNTVGFDTRKQRYRKANDLKEVGACDHVACMAAC